MRNPFEVRAAEVLIGVSLITRCVLLERREAAARRRTCALLPDGCDGLHRLVEEGA